MHSLRKRREELGLSQGDLAIHLMTRGVKISRAMIGNRKRGKHPPALDDKGLNGPADALKWDLTQLMETMSEGQD